jgi:hypothetical protein
MGENEGGVDDSARCGVPSMRSWATVRSCAEPGSTCGHPTAEIRPVPWLFGCCRRVRRLSWNTTGRSDVLAEPAQPPHRSSKAGQRPAVLASTTRRPSACSRRLKYWASSHGIAVWTLTAEGFNVEELLDRLLEVAGGRPMLVERAAALVAAGKEEGQTLTVVADELRPVLARLRLPRRRRHSRQRVGQGGCRRGWEVSARTTAGWVLPTTCALIEHVPVEGGLELRAVSCWPLE